MKTALFTPGPANTSDSVRKALCCDIGTRTPEMTKLTQRLRKQIAEVANCGNEFSVIPLQGSGTFAIEAMLTSLLSENRPCLILINGSYGERMLEVCKIYKLPYYVLRSSSLKPIDVESVEKFLNNHPDIISLALVHFETGIGILNPLNQLIKLAERYAKSVFVDSMSSFGLLSINFSSLALKAVAASSNKILHGPPGLGFIIVRRQELEKPDCPKTLSLNLKAQYKGFEDNGMWRFTPPVQIISSLCTAIEEYINEGGQSSRLIRYQQIASIVIKGLAKKGVELLIPEELGAPIIATFIIPFPKNILSAYSLSELLLSRQLVIYPSQFSPINSFRVGFIGELTEQDAEHLVIAISEIIDSFQVEIDNSYDQ